MTTTPNPRAVTHVETIRDVIEDIDTALHVSRDAVLLALTALEQEREEMMAAFQSIAGISNEDYKTGGFLTGEIQENWCEKGLSDAKDHARAILSKIGEK